MGNAATRGLVESLDGPILRGWAMSDATAGRATGLEIFIGGVRVGETATAIARPDLRASLGRTQTLGFEVRLTSLQLPLDLAPDAGDAALSLEVRFRGTGERLASQVLGIPLDVYRGWTLDTEIIERRVPAKRHAAVASLVASAPSPFAFEDPRLLAFYLPQFHPIAENDEWWGPGFTEWANVTRAKPLFKGHHQPQLPADLGYYDLRVPETRHRQIELAREHGLHGFCFYYYWFGGRRLLERPLDEYIADANVDFPFCICWANENWSRRWDGSESEVLVGQEHDVTNDQRFIRDVIPLLMDRRYIRVDGAPMLLVYRPGLLSDAQTTVDQWRQICREEGVGEIHLAMVESFGDLDPLRYGFDSSVQFPPHGVTSPMAKVEELDPSFSGQIFDYRDVVAAQMQEPPKAHTRYRGVMLAWDNTARRGARATVFHNASPGLYETWLRSAIDATRRDNPPGRRYVFINAWNEWAEGTHLEPDTKYGRAYLQSTRRALAGTSEWPTLIEQANLLGETTPGLQRVLTELRQILEGHDRSLELLHSGRIRIASPNALLRMRSVPPEATLATKQTRKGVSFLDSAVGVDHVDGVAITTLEPLALRGWWFVPEVSRATDSHRFIALHPVDSGETYYGVLPADVVRMDVVEAHSQVPRGATERSGFDVTFSLEGVRPGVYKLFGVMPVQSEQLTFWTPFKGTIEVLAP